MYLQLHLMLWNVIWSSCNNAGYSIADTGDSFRFSPPYELEPIMYYNKRININLWFAKRRLHDD